MRSKIIQPGFFFVYLNSEYFFHSWRWLPCAQVLLPCLAPPTTNGRFLRGVFPLRTADETQAHSRTHESVQHIIDVAMHLFLQLCFPVAVLFFLRYCWVRVYLSSSGCPFNATTTTAREHVAVLHFSTTGKHSKHRDPGTALPPLILENKHAE